jgi:hypothetical protein
MTLPIASVALIRLVSRASTRNGFDANFLNPCG